ncbi:MAG: hypothetical protein ACREIT_02595, partial [Tepidisphaeraceae bacterium]
VCFSTTRQTKWCAEAHPTRSFCGLLSIGEALRQIGAKHTVARRPICFPADASFAEDITFFGGVCRVVNGVRNARYGQVGARPEAFWTCRFDEKQLQRLGPTTGTVEFVAKASPVTLSRVTQDADGSWKVLIEQGQIEDNPASTFGSYGWCRVKNLQHLYRDVLLAHFPHHVALTQGHVGAILWEAMGNYLGFQTYHATQETPGRYTSRIPF